MAILSVKTLHGCCVQVGGNLLVESFTKELSLDILSSQMCKFFSSVFAVSVGISAVSGTVSAVSVTGSE